VTVEWTNANENNGKGIREKGGREIKIWKG
jgi:hypothetical protein